jgi:poly(3-hydroxybutyrate) depolymerase
MSRRFLPIVAALLLAGPAAAHAATRTWTVHYTAADGSRRGATVLLPAGYGPARHPAIPLVISPHGRGASGIANAKRWGDLPGRGGFAVVNPDGLGKYSFGAPGQIDDLARMPELITRALPWLRIDRRRIYAVGSSMGGQETLLLVARHPGLLAGAIAIDAVVDLARRYDEAPELQSVVRRAVGGTPTDSPAAYDACSPLRLAADIARSGVALQVWWSGEDQVIASQDEVSRALLAALEGACVSGFEGAWAHSADMQADTMLPTALARLGLLPTRLLAVRRALRAFFPAPAGCARSAAGSSPSPTH